MHFVYGLRTPKGGIVEEHHLLPDADEFKDYWSRPEININIDDFKIALDMTTHRGKDVGVHSSAWKTSEGLAIDWNSRWSLFFEANENASRANVLNFAKSLIKEFAID